MGRLIVMIQSDIQIRRVWSHRRVWLHVYPLSHASRVLTLTPYKVADLEPSPLKRGFNFPQSIPTRIHFSLSMGGGVEL